jgi:hypothetical protein
LGDCIHDHYPLGVLPSQPGHAVNEAVNESNPAVCAVDLDLNRPTRRKLVGAEVRVGATSMHWLDATTDAGRRKPQICT